VKLGDETTFLKEMHGQLVHANVLQFLIVEHSVQTINHGHEVAIQVSLPFVRAILLMTCILQLVVLQNVTFPLLFSMSSLDIACN
jgi:hypothetical protein